MKEDVSSILVGLGLLMVLTAIIMYFVVGRQVAVQLFVLALLFFIVTFFLNRTLSQVDKSVEDEIPSRIDKLRNKLSSKQSNQDISGSWRFVIGAITFLFVTYLGYQKEQYFITILGFVIGVLLLIKGVNGIRHKY